MMYPEDKEEAESIIKLAAPDSTNVMPAANYQIAGPLAQHQPDNKLRDAAVDTVGGVAGKGLEGALFGGGPKGTFFEKGLWGLGKGAGAGSAYSAGWGSAINPMAAAFKGPGTAAATSGAGAGLSAGMAAAAPWAIPAIMGAKIFGLFNKGGAVGPLSPQYAGEGMYTFPIGHGAGAWDGYRGPDYEDFLDWDGYRGGDYEDDVIDIEPIEGVPFKKGGNVQYKEHGGMTGPLSNNKSVKIEKKETIEYKN